MPSLPSLEKSNSVPLGVLEVPPPAASWAPWVTTGLVLMRLNSYFPQLSPVSSLWSPLRVAIPVLHWVASWWFVSLARKPTLVILAPLLHTCGGNSGIQSVGPGDNWIHGRGKTFVAGLESSFCLGFRLVDWAWNTGGGWLVLTPWEACVLT
ncbi:hypothetical protein DSO57_1035103 [Entomophthora muscae]|uniref:Uncharacterized protein n=1 Tax=Entomophthora muscae TaxID=34485 RepID=A0ACC2SCM4_9FUNG|nr:hypothetical protein DSO57_1035103 [Entomophthora muscae]